MTQLTWTNPLGVNLSPGSGVLYLIWVIDDTGVRHEYLGRTERAEKRLKEYDTNIEEIKKRRPKREGNGEPKYRAVHLALAKAIELGWQYVCYPVENVAPERLHQAEQQRLLEYDYKLNGGRSWLLAEYESLTIADLYGELEPDQQRDGDGENVPEAN